MCPFNCNIEVFTLFELNVTWSVRILKASGKHPPQFCETSENFFEKFTPLDALKYISGGFLH